MDFQGHAEAFEGKRIEQIDAFDAEMDAIAEAAEKKSLTRRDAMTNVTELFCDGEPVEPHQPSSAEASPMDEDEDDDEEVWVPTEQEKYMAQNALAHTRHSGLPRPIFGQKGVKRPREQVDEPEPEADIGQFFDEHGVELRKRVDICSKYASYLRSMLPKPVKTPNAPRKQKK